MREVLRCAVDDIDKLQLVLELLFGYEHPEMRGCNWVEPRSRSISARAICSQTEGRWQEFV